MAKTESTMLPLGTAAPAFRLQDAVSGREVALADFGQGRPLLVMFLCNHCPYVVHVRDELGRVARDYEGRIDVVAVNSNSVETHPEDGPEHMRALALELGWSFPFLFDATQNVAKAYRAACTPDLFLFDGRHRLAYRGQLDGARPGNDVAVTGHDLRRAVEAVLAGREPDADQRPSLGCNIKWKPGNEPGVGPR